MPSPAVMPAPHSLAAVPGFWQVVVPPGATFHPWLESSWAAARMAPSREYLLALAHPAIRVPRIPTAVAVVQEIETTLPIKQDPLPTELARDALNKVRAGGEIVGHGLKVIVEHGWLRLEGTTKSYRHRDDVLRRLRSVSGARGVIDRTHVSG